MALAWLAISIAAWSQTVFTVEIPTRIITALVVPAYAVYALKGALKFTSIAGKLLIAISFFALANQFISGHPEVAGADTLLRSLALISGLVLERISPHQRLKPWMFLMIATKIELVMVNALTAIASGQGVIPLQYWWVLIGMMLLGALFLAHNSKRLYRAVIVLTSLIAIVLAFDFITAQKGISATTALAAGTIIWPLTVERLLGWRVFMRPVVDSASSAS